MPPLPNDQAMKSSPLALTVLAILNYEPLHPYGVQRLLKEWGKDQVVNVGQRAGLYRTIDRLLSAGLIEVHGTGRDQQYPERTVYEATDAGRTAARVWLEEMLESPKYEFPQFPAALSNIMMLMPQEARRVLARRAEALAATLAELDGGLEREARLGLPRVTALESEYLRAVTAAELDWVRSVVADLESGALNWEAESLRALAQQQGS
jgi:DNA-binding PadR family transcriptional regulator